MSVVLLFFSHCHYINKNVRIVNALLFNLLLNQIMYLIRLVGSMQRLFGCGLWYFVRYHGAIKLEPYSIISSRCS